MRAITPELTEELLKHFVDRKKVANCPAFKVHNFRRLVELTAQLSYLNKDYLLFYRGQNKEYYNRNEKSTFYPSIYRGDYLQTRELINKFEILDGACKKLTELFEREQVPGHKELRRRYIQWSILQHYEVCDTPLLDFTQSLRVACSFAMHGNQDESAYVFAFGLPYISNRISINSEHDIVNVRLLSICPPTAYRPYFQEGYMVGTDDITDNFDTKEELDLNNRLIAKFEIPNNQSFWGSGFQRIPPKSLFPVDDPIEVICKEIKEVTDRELQPGTLGEFLKAWVELERELLSLTSDITNRYLSVREAIKNLHDSRRITNDDAYLFESLRKFRNLVVHTPQKVNELDLKNYLRMVQDLNKVLKNK